MVEGGRGSEGGEGGRRERVEGGRGSEGGDGGRRERAEGGRWWKEGEVQKGERVEGGRGWKEEEVQKGERVEGGRGWKEKEVWKGERGRSKYRVAGAGGYRFKPSHSGSSWTGGPLTGSNTSESYLSQSVASSTAPAYRYARPPVCRLLEQAQYAATPTEDDSRPRPPAFTSPAYFLPSLSWLRFPALRQAWPGEGGDADRGSAAYTAAGLSQCHCDQTVHRWLENEERLTESGPASDHEYSEIWDGPPQYSSLTQTPCLPSSGGIGPYEYEMQEAVSRRAVCECERPFDPPHRSRSGQWAGQRHGYDKLWQCGEGSERVYSPESCASSLGHSENGWLSRYRLPTPCTPITDQDPDPEGGAGHIHRPHRPHPTKCWEGGRPGPTMGRNGEARVGQGSIPDSDFLPCQRPLRDYNSLSASVWEPDQDRRVEGRSQVKYVNPVFEGQGSEAACVPGSSPLLSRLWGYVGLNHKS
ncbi:hypothetical protein ACOMHN_039290 [Nucella lapillus]